MATPFIAYHKTQITHYHDLIHRTAYCIAQLKLARKTTKRAQYIQYHQIQARRHLLADYYNYLDFHQTYLDLLSGC